MNQELDSMSDGLTPPVPPPELRRRVLTAARTAMERGDSPDMWTRIWGSRTVRLAWAASIGALIFGHLVIGGPVSAGSAEPAIPLAAVAGTNDELAEIVGLQRVTADLPGWELAPGGAITPEIQPIEEEDLP